MHENTYIFKWTCRRHFFQIAYFSSATDFACLIYFLFASSWLPDVECIRKQNSPQLVYYPPRLCRLPCASPSVDIRSEVLAHEHRMVAIRMTCSMNFKPSSFPPFCALPRFAESEIISLATPFHSSLNLLNAKAIITLL